MKSVKFSVKDLIWSRGCIRVLGQIKYQVRHQVWSQAVDQVWNPGWDQVRDPIRTHSREQLNQLRINREEHEI